MLVKKPLENERRRLFVLYAGTEAHGHIGEVVRDMRCIFGKERRQNHVRMHSESESERLWREAWREKPG